VAGHVPVAIASIASIGPHVKAGKLRGIALTSPGPHPHYPGTPTVADAGVSGFSANAWWGLVAPAKTSPEIIKRLNEAFTKVFNEPDVKATLIDQAGLVYELSTPEQFGKFVEDEVARWAKVIKDNNIAAE